MNALLVETIVLFILFQIGRCVFEYFPEDISSLDYLVNTNTIETEYFLEAFYFSDPEVSILGEVKYDYRNGIVIYPYNQCYSSFTSSLKLTINGDSHPTGAKMKYSYQPTDASYLTQNIYPLAVNETCDSVWDNEVEDIVSTSDIPVLETVLSNYITSNLNNSGDIICAFYDGANLPNGQKISSMMMSSAKYELAYYMWVYTDSSCPQSTIKYSCCTESTCTNYIGDYSSIFTNFRNYSSPAFYQEILRLESISGKYFAASTWADYPCTKVGGTHSIISFIKAPNGGSQCRQYLHYQKVVVRDKSLSTVYTCSNAVTNDCPPGFYCDAATHTCLRCKGECEACTNATSCSKCSRFSSQWKSPFQSTCTLEYFDLRIFTHNYIFNEISPIKTWRATVSYWIYFDETSNDHGDVAHVVLSKYLVMSFYFMDSYIFTHCTVNQIYHKDQSTVIENTFDFTTLVNSLAERPYNSWTHRVSLKLKRRWLYARCAVNYHINRFYVMSSYKKSTPYYKKCDKVAMATTTFKTDPLYDQQLDASDVQYRWYYRENDTTSLKIVNAHSFPTGFFMRNLFVFSEYIPYQNSDNFQYWDLHKIMTSPLDYPEFIFAAPFDEFDQSNYTLNYYNPPYATATPKTISLGPPKGDYSFPRQFYKLLTLRYANKYYSSRDADPNLVKDLPCCENCLFCFDDNRAFTCKDGYYLNTSTYTCGAACPGNTMVGKGLGEVKKGYCNEICKGDGCIVTSPTSFKCKTGYIKTFEKCISAEDIYRYHMVNDRTSLYYSQYFNLPAITIKISSINPNLVLSSYYIEFWFFWETYVRILARNDKNYFFYTNSFHLFHDSTGSVFQLEDASGYTSQNFIDKIKRFGWNRFSISIIESTGRLYINNDYTTPISTFTGEMLNFIVFCHKDEKCIAGEKVTWSGGYYRYLLIWDATNHRVTDDIISNYWVYDYLYILKGIKLNHPNLMLRPEYIPIYYPFNLINIRDNIISDPLFEANNILVVNEEYPGYNFSSVIDYTATLRLTNSYRGIDYSINKCDDSCETCAGITPDPTSCILCNSPLYFRDIKNFSKCSKRKDEDYKGFYALISPILTNEGFYFDQLSRFSHKFTFTFLIKVIGFSFNHGANSDVFIYGYNTKLRYGHNNQRLELIAFGSGWELILGAVENFHLMFGRYVHIAVAYQYNPSRSKYFPPMLHFTVDRKNVPIITTDQLKLSQLDFKWPYIPPDIWAYFAHGNFYSDYLIGSYGFETNRKSLYTPTVVFIDSTKNPCLTDQGMSWVPDDTICYFDYNIQMDVDKMPSGVYRSSGIASLYFNVFPNGEYDSEGKCSFSVGNICYDSCYDTSEYSCSCKSNSNENFIINNSNANACWNLDYLDFARLDKITLDRISIPEQMSSYTIEFWTYVYPYFIQTEFQYDITWNPVMKISLANSLAMCYPQYDGEMEAINFPFSSLKYQMQSWTHIRCSVNKSAFKFYFETLSSSSQLQKIQTDLASVETSTSNGLLIFEDATPQSSWGVVFFRQLRLWQCYACMETSLFTKSLVGKNQRILNLLHLFDPIFNPDFFIHDLIEQDNPPYAQASTRSDFFGYNVIDEHKYSKLKLCNEVDNTSCDFMMQLNAFETIIFPEIPVSKWGRSTIELWLYVEDKSRFENGVFIIWQNHIAVVSIKDDMTGILKVFCFPQEYLISLSGKAKTSFLEILKQYPSYSSKDIVDQEWVWIRCAVSMDMKSYYLVTSLDDGKDDANAPLKPELVYMDVTTEVPFRFFFTEDETSILSIEQANMNSSPLMIRTLSVYDEYLPSNLLFMNVDITAGFFSSLLYNLVSAIDFAKYSIDLEGLEYYVQGKPPQFLKLAPTSPDAVISPKTQLNLCDISTSTYDETSNLCEDYTCNYDSINSFSCNGLDIPLRCKEKYFYTVRSTCEDKCIDGVFRSIGSNIDHAICNWKCDSNIYTSCDLTNDQQSDFTNVIQCREGLKVGVECLQNQNNCKSTYLILANILFNSCYHFPQLIHHLKDPVKEKISSGYFLEFWFLNDLMNGEFCIFDSNERRYLLYAYPHSFFTIQGDENKNAVYYENLLDPNLNGKFFLLNIFEWNCLIIRVDQTKNGISIYLNLKFNEPVLEFLKVDALNQSLTAFAFCSGKSECVINGNGVTITWGSAYYKNLRLYSSDISLSSLSNFITSSSQCDCSSLILFYPLTNMSIQQSIVVNISAENSNDMVFPKSADNGIMYNFSSRHDWGLTHPGSFITNFISRNGEIQFKECHSSCIRCYSESPKECYQCRDGYSFKNGQCRINNGNFLKVPSNNKIAVQIKMANTIPNPVTFTFWVKILAETYSSTSTLCPYIIQFSHTNLFCYDTQSFLLSYMINDNFHQLESKKKYNLIESWTYISISNFNSIQAGVNVFSYFPSMISIYIMNEDVIIHNQISNIDQTVFFDSITLGNEIAALYADIKTYSNFYSHPSAVMRSQDLIDEKVLFSSIVNMRCVNDSEILTNISAVNCEIDNLEITETTFEFCGFNDGYHWIRKDMSTGDTFCEDVPSFDFSRYEKIQVNDISITNATEFTLEFWMYIYPYNISHFDLLYDIKWDYPFHIQITNSSTVDRIQVKCFPLGDKQQFQEAIIENGTYTWFHIECSYSSLLGMFYLNSNVPQEIHLTRKNETEVQLSFLFFELRKPVTTFGFIFIKELKLWKTYNIREFYYLIACPIVTLSGNNFTYLAAYFPGKDIIDSINGLTGIKQIKTNWIGYNFIEKEKDVKLNVQQQCSFLEASPSIGYFETTLFTFTCQVEEEEVEFSYSISGISFTYSQSRHIIQEYSHSNKALFKFPRLNIVPSEYTRVNIFCISKSFMFFTRIILLKPENPVVELVDKKDLLSSSSHDIPLTTIEDDLVLLNSLMLYEKFAHSKLNMTTVINENNSLIVKDPLDNEDYACHYCNRNGQCFLMDKFLTCFCNQGYTGTHCQITQQDQDTLVRNLRDLWEAASNSRNYSHPISLKRFEAMANIIKSVSDIVTDSDEKLFTYAFDLLDYFLNQNYTVFDDNSFRSLSFSMINAMMINLVHRVNILKVNTSLTQYGTCIRNTSLTIEQESLFRNFSKKLESTLQQTAKAGLKSPRSTSWTEKYLYDVFHIYIFYANSTTNMSALTENYEGYYIPGQCFIDQNVSYSIFLSFKIHPFMFSSIISSRLFSSIASITFYDSTYNEVMISNCSEPIKIFFPVYSYDQGLVDYFQSAPERERMVDDLKIFTSPVYVDENGNVSNETQEERINRYHLFYDYRCALVNTSTVNYDYDSGVYYANITERKFIQCNSFHLSSFASQIFYNPPNYTTTTGLFYLNYSQVFMCMANFSTNTCLFLISSIAFVYLILYITFFILEKPLQTHINLYTILYSGLTELKPYTSADDIFKEVEIFIQQIQSHITCNAKDDGVVHRNLNQNSDQVLILKNNRSPFKKKASATLQKNNQSKNEGEGDGENNIEICDFQSLSLCTNDLGAVKVNKSEISAIPEKKDIIKNESPLNKNKRKKKIFSEYKKIEKKKKERKEAEVIVNNFVRKESQQQSFHEEDHSVCSDVNQNAVPMTEYYLLVLLKKYICTNLLFRNIYISLFSRKGIMKRYQRLHFLFMVLFLFVLVPVFILTFSTNIPTIADIILYSVLSSVVSNIIVSFVIFLLRFNTGKSIKALLGGKDNCKTHMDLINGWMDILHSIAWRSIIACVISVIILILSFYISFLFCAVWKSKQEYLVYIYIGSLITDILLEVLWEVLLSLLFKCSEKKLIGNIFRYLERYRRHRTISSNEIE